MDSDESDIERYEREQDEILFNKAGLGRRGVAEYEASDEEVMGLGDSDDSAGDDAGNDDDDYYDQKGRAATRENRANTRNEGWGGRRDNYYGGADDEDAESGQEDEEEEARRIQAAQAARLDEADFFDEDDVEGWRRDAAAGDAGDAEAAGAAAEAPTLDPTALAPEERAQLLADAYPEALLLGEELAACKAAAAELDAAEETPARDIKQTALGSYTGMIYAYFALFTAQLREGRVDLKEHPVMEGILKARELWRLASRIGDAEAADDAEEEDDEDMVEAELEDASDAELLEDDAGALAAAAAESASMSESEFGSEDNSDSDAEPGTPAEPVDEFAIALPTARARARKPRRVDDFDEAADTVELQARAKNKQSLRFYTSEINKRDAVREDKFAGDLDLPYRERAYERRQRLQEAARQRGLAPQDDLGGSDVEDDADAAAAGAATDLYAKARAARSSKSEAKRTRHAEAVAAAKEGRLQEYYEARPDDDKRAITYQMLKNKGIMARRKKESNNARVKKRVKYADAQKKLKGLRKVYTAPTSSYQGEMSGIRKNVVHSTKF